MTLTPVADGRIATVVTYLEMRSPPDPVEAESQLRLERCASPGLASYRRLFRAVGERWLWFSRLEMDDAALAAIVQHPLVELYAVAEGDDAEAGMVELDFRRPGTCNLAFVGLVPRLAGKGHGRWLLAEALRLAWRDGVSLVTVHTCTLDHPAALATYLRAGFVVVSRAIETFADPRLAGILPRDCAPQLPLAKASAAWA